jgi:hypothetical protein
MRYSKPLITLALVAIIASPFATPKAEALSCLSIDMYLADIVGKEDNIIFVGTAVDQIMEKNYTAEVIDVNEVKQGYIENKVFVYHKKDETWGYFCNNGPKEKGSQGLYIATRDNYGKYNVTQRLELNDKEVKTLENNLEKAEITGMVAELSSTDRMNQIMTTITEMFAEIITLLKEHAYWKNLK